MEIKNKITVTRGEWGGDTRGKKGKGQGTCMKDPWTWTTGWGWTVGAGVGRNGGGQRGKIGTTVIEQ